MKTYLFSGKYADYFRTIMEKLDAAGWRPAVPGGILRSDEEPPKKVGLLYVTMDLVGDVYLMAKNTYTIECDWHNQFETKSKEVLDNKKILHEKLQDTTIVTPTKPLSDFVYLNGVWIARPAGRGYHSGKDILYIHDADSFSKAREFYKNPENVIVSEVISNPVLLDGRKSHMRLYLFVCGDIVKFSPLGPMFTAALPYVAADWTNMKIHDTHKRSTDRPWRWPDDYPYKELLPIIRVQLAQFERELRKHVGGLSPYSQARHAFELFAVDLMTQVNGCCRIIEINSKIGMALDIGITKDLAAWVAEQMLAVTNKA